jgi:hypothetical protein
VLGSNTHFIHPSRNTNFIVLWILTAVTMEYTNFVNEMTCSWVEVHDVSEECTATIFSVEDTDHISTLVFLLLDYLWQGRIYSFGGPETIKMWRPPSLTTNLRYGNSFIILLFHIITKNTN